MFMCKKIEIQKDASFVRALLLSTLVIGGAFSLGACQKASYQLQSQTEKLKPAGTFTIPPKVDILMVESNQPGMSESFEKVTQGAKGFLNALSASGWDFHFSVIPTIATNPVISQVAVSQYDGNYGADWKAPYPGASRTAGMVKPSVFRTVESFKGFLQKSDISVGTNSSAPVFETMRKALTTGVADSGFWRTDSLKVIFVINNQDDLSEVNLCTSFGTTVTCSQVGGKECSVGNYTPGVASTGSIKCDTFNSSFEDYYTYFKGLNTLFSAFVAFKSTSQCMGASISRPGDRIREMAESLGGIIGDLCNEEIPSFLSSLQSKLEVQRLTITHRYLFISEDANPESIRVSRLVNGDPNHEEVIPQDATHGWTYAGYVKNVYADQMVFNGQTIPLNQASGFAIELHGSGMIAGGDQPQVEFKPAGVQSSASQ